MTTQIDFSLLFDGVLQELAQHLSALRVHPGDILHVRVLLDEVHSRSGSRFPAGVPDDLVVECCIRPGCAGRWCWSSLSESRIGRYHGGFVLAADADWRVDETGVDALVDALAGAIFTMRCERREFESVMRALSVVAATATTFGDIAC